jgi:hypothetical protein
MVIYFILYRNFNLCKPRVTYTLIYVYFYKYLSFIKLPGLNFDTCTAHFYYI